MLKEVRDCLLYNNVMYTDVQIFKAFCCIADNTLYNHQIRPSMVFSKREWIGIFVMFVHRFRFQEPILLEIFNLAYKQEDVILYTAHTFLFRKSTVSPF